MMAGAHFRPPARFLQGALLAWAVMLLGAVPACRHKPVYPDFGNAVIGTKPQGCEVLIDGQSARRQTPCRLDGLPVGRHRLTLRLNNYMEHNSYVTIKAGETIRLQYTLQLVSVVKVVSVNLPITGNASDLGYDSESATLFVANPGPVLRFSIKDGTIADPEQIDVGGGQLAIAGSIQGNRLFFVRESPTGFALVGYDIQADTVIREFRLPGARSIRSLALSPGGNILLAADSLGRRLLVIDARLCSILRSIPLSGNPSEVIIGPDPTKAYVALTDARSIAEVDIVSGSELRTARAGSQPRGLFWNRERTLLGCCNSTDRQLTILDARNWVAATVIDSAIGGMTFPAACWTDEPLYLLVLVTGRTGGGALVTAFSPNWFTMNRLPVSGDDGLPLRILALPEGGMYLVLNQRTLWMVKGVFR